MEIIIKIIDENSPYLIDVISLGNKNRNELGFLPRKVFSVAARNNNIIIALTSESKCVGYLLFRYVKLKNRVAITQLCVDKAYRGQHIGEKLVTYLKDHTKEWRGIGLYSRRDFSSHSFWPNNGFHYISEKLGRGKDHIPLSYFWYSQNQTDLIDIANEKVLSSKTYQAIIDANIFIDLYEKPNHPLHSNILLDDVVFCVTPELSNEINRDNNDLRRKERLSFYHSFLEVKIHEKEVTEINTLLQSYSKRGDTTRDNSDLIQLSQAIASKSDFFITKDKKLKKIYSNIVQENYGLIIVLPEELIIFFDELLNKASYQESRLVGSSINISRINSTEIDSLVGFFSHEVNEKNNLFREKLLGYLSSPETNETYIVRAQEQNPLAIIVLSNSISGGMEIPFIRIIKNELSSLLASQLALWAIKKAISEVHDFVIVKEKTLTQEIVNGFEQSGFQKINDSWVKVNFPGVFSSQDVIRMLDSRKYRELLNEDRANQIIKRIKLAFQNQDFLDIIKLEKIFWPIKFIDANIPTFVVPIKPTWAMDLFDHDLGSSTLFGSNPSLIFRLDNVYYRSSTTHLPTSPSRVLWYVSKSDKTNYQNVMSIRCCSYVDETIVNTPKELFKQYNKIGVYKWKDLYRASNYEINNKLLAFRFSFDELFPNPISLNDYETITRRNSAPIAPISINNDDFLQIYKMGYEKRKLN